jgi:hypothetical protein
MWIVFTVYKNLEEYSLWWHKKIEKIRKTSGRNSAKFESISKPQEQLISGRMTSNPLS